MKGGKDASKGTEWGRKVEEKEKVSDDIEKPKQRKKLRKGRAKWQRVKKGVRCSHKKIRQAEQEVTIIMFFF